VHCYHVVQLVAKLEGRNCVLTQRKAHQKLDVSTEVPTVSYLKGRIADTSYILCDKEYRKDAESVADTPYVFSADLEKIIMLLRMEMFKSVLFTRRIIAFNETFVPTGKAHKLKPLAVI